MSEDYDYCPKCASPLTTQEMGGRSRRVCSSQTCDFVHWGNPAPVVAALVEHEGCVVLVRNKGWPDKWLGLVAGFLEAGETPEQGVLREVKEEIGLDGEVVGLIGVYPFFQMNQVILAYHVRAHGTIEIGDEIARAKSISLEALKPWPFGTGQAVRDWLAARAEGKPTP